MHGGTRLSLQHPGAEAKGSRVQGQRLERELSQHSACWTHTRTCALPLELRFKTKQHSTQAHGDICILTVEGAEVKGPLAHWPVSLEKSERLPHTKQDGQLLRITP